MRSKWQVVQCNIDDDELIEYLIDDDSGAIQEYRACEEELMFDGNLVPMTSLKQTSRA